MSDLLSDVETFRKAKLSIKAFQSYLSHHKITQGKLEEDTLRELNNNLWKAGICIKSIIDLLDKNDTEADSI